jgi:hypothetical protein
MGELQAVDNRDACAYCCRQGLTPGTLQHEDAQLRLSTLLRKYSLSLEMDKDSTVVRKIEQNDEIHHDSQDRALRWMMGLP